MSARTDVPMPTPQEILGMPVHEARARCGYAYRELRRRLLAEPDEDTRRGLLYDMEDMGRRLRALEEASQ